MEYQFFQCLVTYKNPHGQSGAQCQVCRHRGGLSQQARQTHSLVRGVLQDNKVEVGRELLQQVHVIGMNIKKLPSLQIKHITTTVQFVKTSISLYQDELFTGDLCITKRHKYLHALLSWKHANNNDNISVQDAVLPFRKQTNKYFLGENSVPMCVCCCTRYAQGM